MNFGSASVIDNINPNTRAALFYYRASNSGKQSPEIIFKGVFPNRNSLYFDSGTTLDNFALAGYVDRGTTDSTAKATANSLQLGVWYLAVMTYSDSDGIRLYQGSLGQPIVECSYASRVTGAGSKNSDSSDSLWMGGRNNNQGTTNCDYAFGAFWSGILTLGQMRELQAQLSPEIIRVGPPPASLKTGCLFWAFPGAHGYNKYIDFSGFGNHGAPVGSEIRLAKPAPSVALWNRKYKSFITAGQPTMRRWKNVPYMKVPGV